MIDMTTGPATPNAVVARKIQALARKRLEIMNLTSEEMLDKILDEPQAVALVHSFPEQDFYFLIHDIGVEDSMELLWLASDRQWEFIVDAEVWRKDSMDMAAMTRWFTRLMAADPKRMVRWAANDQLDWLEYYLFWNVDVAIREHDQDPSELGDGFVSDDDTFYVRLVDHKSSAKSAVRFKDERDEFLLGFLHRLSAYDHIRYQQILMESMTVTPAEAEEAAFRMRNVRLAEKGFLPFYEAVGVYQPIDLQNLHRRKRPKALTDISPGSAPITVPVIPMSHIRVAESDNSFVRALQTIDALELFAPLQSEFAALCNQVISADAKPVREKADLQQVVRTVCDYVSLGLAVLAPADSKENADHHRALICRYPLAEIFRVGFGAATKLKWKAERWVNRSWFHDRGLALSFWGEEWLGVLGGLLLKKPMVFNNFGDGLLYRDFKTLEDIRYVGGVLRDAVDMDKLFAAIDLTPNLPEGVLLTWKKMVLTLWARHWLGLDEGLAAIPLAAFRQFYQALWENGGDGRRIRDTMKQSFLEWLSRRAKKKTAALRQRCASLFEALFREMEEEYRAVDVADIDPRYVRLFLIA